MKNKMTIIRHLVERTLIIVVFLLFIFPLFLRGQASREVIKGYNGWAGNPESITVYIDDSFSDAEKDDVREGIKKWNDAGGKPKFVETATPPANVTVKEGDPGDGNAGINETDTDADGKATGSTITIRDNPNPGLTETATHELGHSIGLDDTDSAKNPTDVMKGTGNTNGTDGDLSKHDSTELKAAAAAITAPAPPPAGVKPIKKRALAPPMAIQPGTTGILQFDLDFFFPPLTEVNIVPAGDDLVQVLFHNLVGNILTVGVFLLPGHGSGKFYLDIQVIPPDPMSPVFYLGEHFVNTAPVGPITFQCPFQIHQEGGKVHVDWLSYHTYPNPTQALRAHLTVDGDKHYYARGGGDFVIDDLEPGWHTFILELDDFQINEETFTALYNVSAAPQNVPLNNWAIMIGILLIILVAWFRLRARL